jgi:hypothetical protein
MALPGLPEPPSEIGHAGVWCLGGDRYQEADEPGDCAGNDPGEGSNEPGSFVSLRLPKHARHRQAGEDRDDGGYGGDYLCDVSRGTVVNRHKQIPSRSS